MATKTLYFKDATALGSTHLSLQDGGSAPADAVTATGWTANSKASGQSHIQDSGVEVSRNDGAWGTTLQPSSGPDNTMGDSWRSENTMTGTFASGTWTLNFLIESVTSAYSGRCRLGYRVWRSANADGSSAVEITSGRITTAATTANLSTSAATTITGSFNPGAVTLTNEYLFVNIGIEVTSAGGSNTQDVLMAVGSAGTITTPDFSIVLSGQSMTLTPGSLGIGQQLTGQQANFGQGKLGVGCGLTGQQANFGQGSISPGSPPVTLTGQQANFGQGKLGVGCGLTGQNMVMSAGSVIADNEYAPPLQNRAKSRILLAVIQPQVVGANSYTTLSTHGAGIGLPSFTANMITVTGFSCFGQSRALQPLNNGKHYWESTHTWNTGLHSDTSNCGLVTAAEPITPQPVGSSVVDGEYSAGAFDHNGNVMFNSNTVYSLGSTLPSASVVRHYFDADSGLYQCALNNGPWITVFNDPLLAKKTWYIAAYAATTGDPSSSGSVTVNFGATTFSYVPPETARKGVYANPVTTQTLYLSSDEFYCNTGATIDGLVIPNYTIFDARVSADLDVVITSGTSCWVQGNQSQSSRGQLALVIADGLRDYWLDPSYLWRDAPVTILEVNRGDDISTATTWTTAIVEDKTYDDTVLTLTLTDILATLDRPAQTNLYDDTVKNPQLINQPKPFGFGRPLYCEGNLLDVSEVSSMAFRYDLSALPLAIITAIYDMGDVFDSTVDWSYSSSRRGFQLVNKPIGKVTVNALFGYTNGEVGAIDASSISYPNELLGDSNGGRFGYTDASWPTSGTNWTITHTGTVTVGSAGLGDGLNEGAQISATGGAGNSVTMLMNNGGMMTAGMNYKFIQRVAFSLSELTGSLMIVDSTGAVLATIYQDEGTGNKEVAVIATSGTTKIGFKIVNGSFTINNVHINYLPVIVADYLLTVIPYLITVLGGVASSYIDMNTVIDLCMKTGIAYRIAYYNKGEAVTILSLLRDVMDCFCGYIYSNRLGKIAVGRFEFPKLTTYDFAIDETNIVGVPSRVQDSAQGLTTTLQGGKNNTVHSDSDISTTADASFREQLKSEYTITKVASIGSLATSVNPQLKQAIAAEPKKLMLQDAIAVQAEANRVGTLWREQTGLVTLSAVFDRAAANAIEPGQTGLLTYPRYGFDSGRPMLLKTVTRTFFTNVLTMEFFQPDESALAAGSYSQLRISGVAPSAVNGMFYEFAPQLANAISPTITRSGSIPSGMSFDSSTGVISGTSTVDGTYDGTINVVDSDGRVSYLDYSIVVETPVANPSGKFKALDGQTLAKNRSYYVGSGIVNLYLPDATGLNEGDWVELSKEDINYVIITSNGGSNIICDMAAAPDSSINWDLGATLVLMWNGTNWMINV